MAKYINADLLREEIKKRLKNVRDYMTGVGMKYKGPKYFKAQGKESAYDALLNVITSLQQEQPEVDLEKEIEKEWREADKYRETDYSIAELTEKDFEALARHFYELGLNARKEK